MTADNLIFLYKDKQFSTLTSLVDCEYTDCSAKTEKLFVIGEDVWQFCGYHSTVVLGVFCKVENKT